VVLLIFTVFSFVKLPVIAEGTKIGETDDATIIKAPLSRQPHFKWGVFTQFLYIISQIGINAFAVNYIVDNAIVKDAAGTQTTSPFFSWYGNLMHAGTADATAAYVISFAMILYAVGRFSAAPLTRFIKPNLLLGLYGVANVIVLLVAIADIKMVSWLILPLSWLFMSIMFPFIFAMSIRNLGEKTKIAASFHVMAVGAAGSISAVAMGWLWDHFHSVGISFTLPLIGFVATAIYGFVYPKLLAKSEKA
jgi:FHS family L-fucose permease-like MFS transporter